MFWTRGVMPLKNLLVTGGFGVLATTSMSAPSGMLGPYPSTLMFRRDV